MKKYILTIITSTAIFFAHGQIGKYPNLQTADHTPMMNGTWESIDKMMYKVTTKDNKKIYTPYYPPELKKLENTTVELPGYLIPLTSGRNHKIFMLSVLPITQCQFCGTNGIPPMVEIFMKKESVRYSEDPIKIRGKMKFNPEPLQGNSEIQLVDAELVP